MNSNNILAGLNTSNLSKNAPKSGSNVSVRNSSGKGMNRFLKYALLILALVVLIYLVVKMYRNISGSMASSPMIVNGTIDGNKTVRPFPANKIIQSIDGAYGIEFSYNFWINVSKWTSSASKHIFHKGTQPGTQKGGQNADGRVEPIQIAIQAPGVWLDKAENNLRVCMNVFNDSDSGNKHLECFTVNDIPLNKWVNIAVVVINRNVDVYINGHLKRRHTLSSLPVQNYENVYVNAFDQGIDGNVSNLQYFNYALPIWKIEQIMNNGPTAIPPPQQPPSDLDYLAPDYYLGNQ